MYAMAGKNSQVLLLGPGFTTRWRGQWGGTAHTRSTVWSLGNTGYSLLQELRPGEQC
jgi:hypothetical protein